MLTASTLRPYWGNVKSSLKEMSLLKRIPAYSLASGIVIVTGLAREMIVASTFGLSGDLDVLIAVMGFHLLFGVQVGNAIEHVFVSKMASERGGYLKPMIMRGAAVLLAFNALALLLLVLGSGPVLQLVFPQFTSDQYDTGVRLTRWLTFPIACAGLAGLMRGGLAVIGSFAPVFLGGAVVSLSTIISIMSFADRWGIDALVWGFAAGHFLVLVWFLYAFTKGIAGSPKTTELSQAVWIGELWTPVGWVLLGECVFQATVMTERSFASGLGTGNIAAFFYAGSIMAAPMALFTTPINTAVFPKLTRAFSAGYHEGRKLLLQYGTLLFGGTLLVSVILALAAEPLVEVALARGKFSAADAQLTAHILSMLAWGLPFASLYGMVRNSFFSLSDYRTPLAGYGIRWATLAVCGAWLIPVWGVDGLALASVLAQIADTGTIGWLLQRRLLNLPEAV